MWTTDSFACIHVVVTAPELKRIKIMYLKESERRNQKIDVIECKFNAFTSLVTCESMFDDVNWTGRKSMFGINFIECVAMQATFIYPVRIFSIASHFERYIFLMSSWQWKWIFLSPPFSCRQNVPPQILRLSFAVNAARMHEPTIFHAHKLINLQYSPN